MASASRLKLITGNPYEKLDGPVSEIEYTKNTGEVNSSKLQGLKQAACQRHHRCFWIVTFGVLVVIFGVTIYLVRRRLSALQPAESSNNPEKEVSDEDLLSLSARLWEADHGRISGRDLQINTKPGKLFAHVTPAFWSRPSVEAFVSLLDNYEALLGYHERKTRDKEIEEKAFLDAVFTTDVMKETFQFLTKKDCNITSLADFRGILQQIWFTLYSRQPNNVVDSSGFEHVFVGEIKTKGLKNTGSVTGLHSWIQAYREEQGGGLEYQGCLNYLPGLGLEVSFKWGKASKKPSSSMLLGTSPELDLAVYTVCLLTRTNSPCPVKLGGATFDIQTYNVSHSPMLLAGSAYPVFPSTGCHSVVGNSGNRGSYVNPCSALFSLVFLLKCLSLRVAS